MPATSSPRKRPRSISRSASRREQPNLRLSGQSASLASTSMRMITRAPGACAAILYELLLGIGRELLDADGVGVGDVGGALDGVAEGDVARPGTPSDEAEVDLAARGRVETPAEGRDRRDHLGRRVGLDRVVDRGAAEAGLERAVLGAQHLEVEDHRSGGRSRARGCRRPGAR